MRRSKKTEALVGAYTLVGCALLAILLFLMGGLDGIFAKNTEVTAIFRDVQGLQTGDPVYLYGDRVGRVISIDTQTPSRDDPVVMRVKMLVPSEKRALIRTTTKVVIDKSLTGNISVLMQQIGDAGGPSLPDGSELVGSESSGFDAITKRASAVLEEAKTAIVSIRRVVDDVRREHLRPRRRRARRGKEAREVSRRVTRKTRQHADRAAHAGRGEPPRPEADDHQPQG